jgi:hypothetical protein
MSKSINKIQTLLSQGNEQLQELLTSESRSLGYYKDVIDSIETIARNIMSEMSLHPLNLDFGEDLNIQNFLDNLASGKDVKIFKDNLEIKIPPLRSMWETSQKIVKNLRLLIEALLRISKKANVLNSNTTLPL